MAIEPLAIWSIPPDWRSGASENLAWLSSVSESPFAVEQRMGLRLSPRQSFDFNYTVWKGRRTYFDLLTMQASGSPAYLPLWHEVERLTVSALAGAATLSLPTDYTEFQTASFAYLRGQDAYTGEIVEIISYSSSTITLGAPLENPWPAGTRIYPVKKVRVESQPTADRRGDAAFQTAVRFISLEPNLTTAQFALTQFMGHPVLETDPNEIDNLSYGYNRKMTVLDNQTGLSHLFDVAPFVHQTYSWFAKGREAQSKVRALFYTLQGRRVPLWISSVFADFELVSDVADDATTMDVKRCGYTDAGGPFVNREYISIQLYNGTKLYRKITAAALVGDGSTERLAFDAALGIPITPETVHRISFLSFCRLDQDSIELIHHANTTGLMTATAVFRTDPGISGINNEQQIEVPPIDPEVPVVNTIIDPFRLPAGKLWQYVPSFSTFINNLDWTGVWWAGRRSDAELLAQDNPRLPPDVGDAFPPFNISGSGATVTLPDTGSFLVRAGLYFSTSFGTATNIFIRIVFLNSTLDPVELSGIFSTGMRYQLQSGRDQVYFAKLDVEQPLRVEIHYRAEGTGGNIHPQCNPTFDCEPYHGKAGAVAGDSYFIVEWWPD